ncbi:DUF3800 domain-containing protein [Knoellia sp. p5-6-4]|uniref:DUF3800 domain-containing protein n=1 Tax=unclassified Knoellia TaxID=2618719 RepID=UPI0023DC9B1B|nr:DUF3800 domain-containing protein [Knoellia sp. p5-6-4]MDF2146755.1 DUF3800 domain-containing protein [Knoellia sp. p5-6-4]
MASLIYVDETGSVGKGASKQPLLILAAVIVHEDQVQPLAASLGSLAFRHLDYRPKGFEFHGVDLWNGKGYWAELDHAQRLAAYEDAISVLQELELEVAYSSIHKARLHARHGGAADANAYLLALQFLLEKIDLNGGGNKIVVADEAKEQELRAINMVADMAKAGGGEVPGRRINTMIDSLHFVSSHASPGVQLADLVAFILQRHWYAYDRHPLAQAAVQRMANVVQARRLTWRETWPSR